LTILRVDATALRIAIAGENFDCTIGRSGACAADRKREGDGCTPCGTWPLRAVLLRRDVGFQRPARLPWRWIRPDDGWSDDPADPGYNCAVRHPHPFSAERLHRNDPVYDAVVVLGFNDAPPVAGHGSAIFVHLQGDHPWTEGCVALPPPAMRHLLANSAAGDMLEIVESAPLLGEAARFG
jgi:L,D-peptidoglycan transpeptidase YkuD (ErfK/YbiS/YcfS/YnhG family)